MVFAKEVFIMMKKKLFKKGLSTVLLVVSAITLHAQQQLENTMSQYFHNRILLNPAYTGIDGNKLYALQNRSYLQFEGAPVMNSISGEVLFGKNSALGIQVLNDKSGALIRSIGAINYAYRVQVGEEKYIRLGVALAFNSDRLNAAMLRPASLSDPAVQANLTEQKMYDANFGIVYNSKKTDLFLSFNRIGNNLQSDWQIANLSYLNLGVSYSIFLDANEKIILKPISILHLYRSTWAVADFGFQLNFNQGINGMAIYQTSGNIKAGAGIKISGAAEANFYYHTNYQQANTFSQQFEIGLGVYLGGKKK